MRTVRHKDSERLVHYGDPDLPMRRNNEEARENFLARHRCDTKKDPFAAGFWACYDWSNPSEKGVEGIEMSRSKLQVTIGQKAQERKTLPFIVTKIDGDQGIVEHTVAVMGNVDLGGDRIHPGAFTKTISERGGKIRVLDAHNSNSVLNVIGKPLSLWEAGRDDLPAKVRTAYPDATGALMARTQFLMDTPEGKGAFTRIRDGAVDEYSIGYDPITADYSEEERDGKSVTVRNLKEIRLWEYSPVAFAMNPATSTLSAKGDKQEAIDNLSAFLADATLEQRADLWQAWVMRKAAELLGDKGASGSTALPIADRERAWDAQAAAAGIRRATGSEDAPSSSYKDGFFWYDSNAPDEFGSYKLPFAAEVDGELVAIPRGVFAAAAAVQGARGGVDIPDGDRASVRSKIDRYYARMRSQFDDDGIVPPWDKAEDGPEESKIGRTFSAANVARIQGAIDAAQTALSDLEDMLASAMPAETEPEQEEQAKDAPPQEAATGQETEAGPQTAPTSEEMMAEIDQILGVIETELSEEQ